MKQTRNNSETNFPFVAFGVKEGAKSTPTANVKTTTKNSSDPIRPLKELVWERWSAAYRSIRTAGSGEDTRLVSGGVLRMISPNETDILNTYFEQLTMLLIGPAILEFFNRLLNLNWNANSERDNKKKLLMKFKLQESIPIIQVIFLITF